MKRLTYFVRIFVVLVTLLSLIPLGQMLLDWVKMSRVLGVPTVDTTGRGFDWVVWEENDGRIVAGYVFEQDRNAGPALRAGDEFYQLDYQQYFNVDDLQRAIDGIPPGSVRTYSILRDGQPLDVEVRFTRYPIFLYPLSTSLWWFSLWGFFLGAFFHLLGLIIAVPLTTRSREARFSLCLIVVSSFWMFGNLLRLLLVEIVGPIEASTIFDQLFQVLTLIGLVGWIGFPALLLHKVLRDVQFITEADAGWFRFVIYLPTALLGIAALAAALYGAIGPITLTRLLVPILFYVCCYVAAAAALMLACSLTHRRQTEEHIGGWSKAGSALMFVLALLFALSVLGVVPLLGVVNETMIGWFIVAVQLLSIVPVILVSVATLRHGKIDQVLTRALTYLTVLGLIFFAFVGGLALIDPYLDRLGFSRTVFSGLYVVLLLVIFERIARRLRIYATGVFATDRQRARQHLSRFQEQMRSILDHNELAQRAIETLCEAFQVRSGRIYLRPLGLAGPWVSSAHHPEPPYLTERAVMTVWPYMHREGRIWARNPELNESTLPEERAAALLSKRAVLAVPIMGDGEVMGLVVLGEKKQRRAVYNLEDLDMLRAVSGQLALAVERLNLVERERALIRESAEAQLTALRAQINPHFLFNALNTIVALIEEQPEEAVEAVEHLAAIFRHILHTGGRAFVSVSEEFALVSHYLSIEQARFGERLRIERNLDAHLRSQPVPAFAVQTLVENAVKHGLEKRRDGGVLRLTCKESEEGLMEITVEDEGVGIPALFGEGEVVVTEASFLGIGLRNVAGRLEKLYERTDLLRMNSDPLHGTTARLLLPATATINNEQSVMSN